jgi:hypothetical protein
VVIKSLAPLLAVPLLALFAVSACAPTQTSLANPNMKHNSDEGTTTEQKSGPF